MDPWKRRFLLETIISRFHVEFRGCTSVLHQITLSFGVNMAPTRQATRDAPPTPNWHPFLGNEFTKHFRVFKRVKYVIGLGCIGLYDVYFIYLLVDWFTSFGMIIFPFQIDISLLSGRIIILIHPTNDWLVVEPTHLKHISQIGNLPQIGMKMKKYLKPPPRWYIKLSVQS